MATRRGQCPACRYSIRLRKDGSLQAHRDFTRQSCQGSGRPPRPFDPGECGGCLMHRFATPGLTEACASVGIEHGKSAGQMLRDYLTAFHENGHERELPG